MTSSREIKIAYQLLPPPLSALPAKYWTSISLWLHSYTVARTFQEFVRIYGEIRDVDTPDDIEAFTIGYLHDLGQKLNLRGKTYDDRLLTWVKECLEEVEFTKGEADDLSRYIFTNPAETLSDPLYHRSIWRLLWLADRLQGIDNPLDLVTLLEEAKDDLGTNLNVIVFSVSIPQPFLRTLISKIVHDRIRKLVEYEGTLLLPISTPYGLTVITDEHNLSIEIDWDEIRKGFEGKGLLEEKIEEDLEWDTNCCEMDECKKSCSSKNKKRPTECIDHKMSPDSCNKAIYLGKKTSTYKLTLLYYGLRKRVQNEIILPDPVKSMMAGINLKEVSYKPGGAPCPICGVQTPTGVMGDYPIFFFGKRVATEQWTRNLFPGNLNSQIMRNPIRYAIDPLCMGEIVIRSRFKYRYLISLSVRAFIPLSVLEDVGRLFWSLWFHIGNGMPKAGDVPKFIYGKEFIKTLDRIAQSAEKALVPNFYYDAFSASTTILYRNPMQKHQDEWLRDTIIAGILSAWGLYPVTISETIPAVPTNTLLSYYKGRKPLYDYQPNDKRVGEYTPYVATTMMSLAILNYRKNTKKEDLPAVLEVLDYSPEYSPLLLQYGSPNLYSRVESLRKRIGVRI